MHFPASGKWLTDGLFHPKTQDQRGLIKETVSQIGVGKNQYIPLPASAPPPFNLLKCFGHRLTFFTNLLLLHLPWNGNCRHFDKWIERLSSSSGALKCFPGLSLQCQACFVLQATVNDSPHLHPHLCPPRVFQGRRQGSVLFAVVGTMRLSQSRSCSQEVPC